LLAKVPGKGRGIMEKSGPGFTLQEVLEHKLYLKLYHPETRSPVTQWLRMSLWVLVETQSLRHHTTRWLLSVKGFLAKRIKLEAVSCHPTAVESKSTGPGKESAASTATPTQTQVAVLSESMNQDQVTLLFEIENNDEDIN
jgi:hypothetical protein